MIPDSSRRARSSEPSSWVINPDVGRYSRPFNHTFGSSPLIDWLPYQSQGTLTSTVKGLSDDRPHSQMLRTIDCPL